MAADPNIKCHILADTIAALLGDKIQAGPDVIEYINSIYGNPDIVDIQSLIKEQDSSERESLVDLLLFPDESVQVQLEEVLQKTACTSEEVVTIADELANRGIDELAKRSGGAAQA